MNNKLISFGKYRDQPVEVMIEDKSYCDWFLAQSEMKNKHAWIFQAIQNAIQLEDTPEHNALQMRFMNKEYCNKLGNYVYELNKKNKGAEQFETTYTLYKDGKNIKDEIANEFSKEITRIIVKDFTSLIAIFNVHGSGGGKNWENADFKELREYHFDKYDLKNYLEYLQQNNDTWANKTDTKYIEKNKEIDNIINKIKEEILLNLKPLLSFKKIEEIYEYNFLFSLNSQIIKFECNLTRDRYSDNKLLVEDIKITTFIDKEKEIIPSLIQQINDNNNFKTSGEVIFEKNNIDVIYDFYPSKKAFEYHLGYGMKIELKPSISEDYMTILRKANSDKVNVVFCDKITAQSTSIENIKKAYKTHNIDLVISRDLELLHISSNEVLNPLELLIKKIDSISINGKCDTEEIKQLFIEAMKK